MKHKISSLIATSVVLLSACGGGGDENTPPPEAKVSLQLQSTNLSLSAHQGDALKVAISGNWSGTNLGTQKVYLKLYDEANKYIVPAVSAPLSGNGFTLETVLNYTLPVGEYAPKLSVLACKDANCATPYSGSAAVVNLQLQVAKVPEWQTHQANAAHTGYVPVWLSTSNFTKLWEWNRGPSDEPIGGINAPVAGNGTVYVSTDVYHGDARVLALDELTGVERWRVSFGVMPALNPPAINDSTLFVATSGHSDTKVWAIDRADGKLKFQSNFLSQWGNYLAPTVYDDKVYQTGGYYGGFTYAFNVADGVEAWSQSAGTSWGMDTPAVDDKQIYVHNGIELTILDKDSGDKLSSISDPFGNTDYSYHGAPVLGSEGRVIAFSGGAFSGRASSNAEHYEDRVISGFDSVNQKHLWTSRFSYRTFFALANGVIYAGKNNPVALDAIDEKTGEVLWSWVAPSTDDTAFHRNVVVTNNLLFVSTNANVYAVDIASQQKVWSHNEPGTITLSDNRILLIATGARESDGRLLAFDLRNK
ncbi:PQQ-binding-like beta-propeller repeat protein [Shewanella sp. JM162201]|uniref:PQQ-binding-like beta-propeller repeat protein n=1 Tax=Shewanella jiangmenensis TaxID=2837387 RepID=A0ABS5V991_9GAMM|nr:PQQ-binding-like beta-propeller repeat protein [Shewanella jiangmenensis]MBT1446573.1 PQQ-binding-like beta-propeller repeat protein [Shewanella jiangmenensis]